MLFERTEIEFYERQNQYQLNHAFDAARNRDTVSRSDKLLLHIRERSSLLAVNRHSRVIWGKAVCEQLEEYFCSADTTDHDQTIYWVTLVDINCAVSVDATNVDIDRIKSRLRSGLYGLNFFGVVEPAFYVNLQHGRFPEPRCMFWHLHALVWEIRRSDLSDLLKDFEASGRYIPIADGFKGVQAKKIKQGDLPTVVGYMLKSPCWAYRLSRLKEKGPDGQVQTDIDGQPFLFYMQGTSELRPGERIILFHAMKRHYLDQLTVSGGQGVALLARAKRQALAT